MLKRRQKVSHNATYHKPSFRAWLRYSRFARNITAGVFLLFFSTVGYMTYALTSAANVVYFQTRPGGQTVRMFMYVTQPNGQELFYGYKYSPGSFTNEGYTRVEIDYGALPSGYTFDYWELPTGQRSYTDRLGYNPTSYNGKTFYVALKSTAPAPQPQPQPQPPPSPSVSIWASANPVNQNSSLTINWYSSNSTYCIATDNWSGTKGTSGSEDRSGDTSIPGQKTYSITCYNSAGVSIVGRTYVTVNSTASPPATPPTPPRPPQPPATPPSSPSTPPASPGTPPASPSTPPASPATPPASPRTPSRPGTTTRPATLPVTAAPSDTSDKTPPDAPVQLILQSSEDDGAVEASWPAATDNVGVSHYVLERSIDDTTWEVLADRIAQTFYLDSSITYDTRYFYRLKAVDTNNNESGYVGANLTTASFRGNVTAESGGDVRVDEGWLSVKIPAGAVPEDAQCAIRDDNDVALPQEPGEALLAGPYRIVCRQQDGEIVSKFSKPVIVTMQLDKDITGKYNRLRYLTGNGEEWEAADAEVNGDTVVFETENTYLSVVGSRKGTPLWAKILLVLLGIGLLAGAVLGILYWRYRRQQEEQYEDYTRQQYGL